MPELKDTILTRLGVADALAAKAKSTAKRLSEAAAKHHDATNEEINRLQNEIEESGVGVNEKSENDYCRALVTKSHMAQAHTLAARDAARMPELDEDPHLSKALPSALPFVPPDVPRWRGKNPEGERFLPLNGVEDRPKFWGMVKEMRGGDWEWDQPLVRCGDQLLSGSHRYAAAKEAGVSIETIPIDVVFAEAGMDFKETWEAHAQPFVSWLSNMDFVVQCLPEAVREKYGIDLG